MPKIIIFVWIKTFPTVKVLSSFFWPVTQHWFVRIWWRFGINRQSRNVVIFLQNNTVSQPRRTKT
jgi:hypothetical protein